MSEMYAARLKEQYKTYHQKIYFLVCGEMFKAASNDSSARLNFLYEMAGLNSVFELSAELANKFYQQHPDWSKYDCIENLGLDVLRFMEDELSKKS